jgi:hypothetical protein
MFASRMRLVLVFVGRRSPICCGCSFAEASIYGFRNDARSLALTPFCFVFSFLQTFGTFWYGCRFLTAFVMSGSSMSLDSALEVL